MECRRYGLLIIDVQGLSGAKPLIIGIINGNGAVVAAEPASRAQFLIHIAGKTANLCGKMAYFTRNG